MRSSQVVQTDDVSLGFPGPKEPAGSVWREKRRRGGWGSAPGWCPRLGRDFPDPWLVPTPFLSANPPRSGSGPPLVHLMRFQFVMIFFTQQPDVWTLSSSPWKQKKHKPGHLLLQTEQQVDQVH